VLPPPPCRRGSADRCERLVIRAEGAESRLDRDSGRIEIVQTELNPGDVLVHDVMLVHGSEATLANRLRRTIYYEFRSARQILDEGPWDAAFIDQRLRLVSLGLSEWKRQNPGETAFDWNVSEALAPMMGDDAEDELRVAHAVHSPGSYCSAGNVATRPNGRPV